MKSTNVVASLLLLLLTVAMQMNLVKADEDLEYRINGQLSQCMDYLVYGHQGRPELFQARYNSEILKQCCKQLEEVKQECRCDAINQMLLEDEKRVESHKLEGVIRRARNLPAMCNMKPHRCDFHVYF